MWLASFDPPDYNKHRKIVERFQQLYERVGKPKGATLFDVFDAGGALMGYFMTDEAAQRLPELLEEFKPWRKVSHVPLNWRWAAGDENVSVDRPST
jgi:hypothetical protein